MRDFNIFATTKTNHRAILENLKQMALTNNTTGASIYELGNIVKADSIAEVTDILKDSEVRQQAQRQQEMQQQQQMQQQALEAKAQEEQQKLQVEIAENDKDRQNDITLAEIRSAGFGASADINQNQQSEKEGTSWCSRHYVRDHQTDSSNACKDSNVYSGWISEIAGGDKVCLCGLTRRRAG